MKNHHIIKRLAFALTAAVASLSPLAAPAVIAEEEGSTNGFTMSPMYEKITLDPGSTYSSSFKIHNPDSANTTFYYKTFVQPYYRDEDGNAIFDDVDGMSQIVDWTTFDTPETGSLEPDESAIIEFTVKVPEDAPAGGQYMAITVSSDNSATDQSGNAITVQESVAMGYTVYAEVTGTTIRDGEITEASLPSFLISGDIVGSSKVKNTGNVHGVSTYKLQIFPLFSNEEVYTNEEEPDTRLILPNRSVYFETHWDATPPIGIYNAKYTVEFEGVETVVEKLVIICPIWTMFVIILAIILLIIWLVVKNRSLKKQKRAISSASSSSQSSEE